MYHFASDNTAGICPEVLEYTERSARGYSAPYGDDVWTQRAADALRELFEHDCEVFFTFNGTAANALSLAAMSQCCHSVVCSEVAHIDNDECGAPEMFSGGAKLLPVAHQHGLLCPHRVHERVKSRSDLHFPRPRVLSLTQATELGTVYTPDALRALGDAAARLDLHLHLDGARLANAIATLGCSPADLTWRAGVDVLCFCGTKNGMAIGEAILFFDRRLAEDFSWRCKQGGQLASKMRYITAPWLGLLETGAWLRNAQHANAMAQRLKEGLLNLQLSPVHPVDVNMVFVDLPPRIDAALQRSGWRYSCYQGPARWVCSWQTRPEDVDNLLADIAAAQHNG